MTAGEKALGATAGTIIAGLSVYFFFHFQAQDVLAGSPGVYKYLAIVFLPVGLHTFFYWAFVPVKDKKDQVDK